MRWFRKLRAGTGLRRSNCSAWRRQARRPAGADVTTEAPRFVPAVVESALPEGAARRQQRQRARAVDRTSGIIEVEIEGVRVRVGRGADAKTVAAVIRALKAGSVIGPTGAVRVMMATKPVDFRKGAEGLAALVRETMKADPFSGAVYVFRAKRADRVKLIFWDGTGVCLFAKRLEDGEFRWPNVQDGVMRLRLRSSRRCWKGSIGDGFTPRARPRRRRSQADLRQSESVRSKCSQRAAAHDVITP